jgi:hypothetical protein
LRRNKKLTKETRKKMIEEYKLEKLKSAYGNIDRYVSKP